MTTTPSTRHLSAEAARSARRWYIVDAEGQVLGRLASRIASVLRGKNKAEFSPHVDAGDFVVVVNAAKVRLTGRKLTDKLYIRHTGYPGGARQSRACCRRTGSAAASRPSSRSTRGPIIRTRRSGRARCRRGEATVTKPEVTTYWGTGKRKTSVARVRLKAGGGEVVVNGRPLEAYFGRETSRMIVQQPFEVTSSTGQF